MIFTVPGVDEPIYYVDMKINAFYPVKLKKNVRIQILSKIKREGWLPDGAVDTMCNFILPDRSMILKFWHSAPTASELGIAIYKAVPVGEAGGKEYRLLAQASYKDYIRWGSKCILTEALL